MRRAISSLRHVSVTSTSTLAQTCRAAPLLQFQFQSQLLQVQTTQMRSFSAEATFLDIKMVTDRIIEVVKNFEKVEANKVSTEAKFKDDLDLDSLDAVEVVMAIEEEFGIEIPDAEADKILSIPQAVAFVANHPMAK